MVGADWRLPLCGGVLQSIQSLRRLGTTVNLGGASVEKGRLVLPVGLRGQRRNMFLWLSVGKPVEISERRENSAKGELGEDCNLPPLWGERDSDGLLHRSANLQTSRKGYVPCTLLILDTSSWPTSSASVEVAALPPSLAVCKIKDLCVSRSAGVLSTQRGARV